MPEITNPNVTNNTDTIPLPAKPPALPPAGSKFVDPTFGSEILRVTDASTGINGESFGLAYSYWYSFNADNTKIFAHSRNGQNNLILDFDPVNFKMLPGKRVYTHPPADGYTTTESLIWSKDADTVLNFSGAKYYKYNVNTGVWTFWFDLAPHLHAGAYILQPFFTRDNDRVSFTIKNADASVWGWGVYEVSTNRMIKKVQFNETPSLRMDEVAISRSGRWLIEHHGDAQNPEATVFDLTDAVPKFDMLDGAPHYAPGHKDIGWDAMYAGENWLNTIRKYPMDNPGASTKIIDFKNSWYDAYHVGLQQGAEDWVTVSPATVGAERGLYSGEIIMGKTDGSVTYRLAHHWIKYKSYEDNGFAQISSDAKYIIFASNWNDSGRSDIFILRTPIDGGKILDPNTGGGTGGNTGGGTTGRRIVNWLEGEIENTLQGA